MKITTITKLAAAIAAASALAGCLDSDSDSAPSIAKVFNCTDDSTQGARVICIGEADDLSDATVQSELVTKLLQAQTGDTFVFPQGRYNLSTTVSFQGLDEDNAVVKDLTFKGAGMDKTIFDVSGSSADGFKFDDTDNLVFEDFGVYESNNNAIKVIGSDGVIMRRIATVWETDYQATNGAYGLYPVESSNILIEDSFVKGSADAGIYVGQSSNIVVRNNEAVKNVAGIEIENSNSADVYNNVARGNTGGILVFDLPIGNGQYGQDVRVFDNIVDANNAPNFAAGCTEEQKAADTCFEGGVHIVPPGTGIIVLSTSNVEIYKNTITDHQTTSVAISSYMLPDDRVAQEPNQDVGGADADDATPAVMAYSDISKFADKFLDGWSPFVHSINIHDNIITVADGINAPEGDLISDIILGFGIFESSIGAISGQERAQLPHILYDGVGQLLATTPVNGVSGASIMQAITTGINQVAAAVHTNIITPTANAAGDPVPTLLQIDVNEFGAYGDFQGVCQSANGVDGVSITAASVFETVPTANTFDGTNPVPKVEQALAELAAGTLDGMATKVLSDDLMTCAGVAYTGSAATVTVGTETFGCSTDDTAGSSCSL